MPYPKGQSAGKMQLPYDYAKVKFKYSVVTH